MRERTERGGAEPGRVLARLDELPRDRPWFAAVGKFDGVHRGHRAVLQTLVREARRAGAGSTALTFWPHPLEVLRPDDPPPLLTTRADRQRLILAAGVDRVVELAFGSVLASVSAEDFIVEHLCRRGGIRCLFAGPDWRFGRRGAGTVELARQVGQAACGLRVETLPVRRTGGDPISSTRIRDALRSGRVGLARRLLGRPYAVTGTVIRGRGRGAGLGFPTANVVTPDRLVRPADGVYAVQVEVGGVLHPGVANIGVRPTFGGGDEPLLEAHIFEYHADLYGETLRVIFIARLRGERRFPDAIALRQQIARDAERARRLLAPWRSQPDVNPD